MCLDNLDEVRGFWWSCLARTQRPYKKRGGMMIRVDHVMIYIVLLEQSLLIYFTDS
jgi:hypothetical protein